MADNMATTFGCWSRGPREVGGQRQAHGLHHVHAEAGHQEGDGGGELPGPGLRPGVAGKHQQREGHHRQAAELDDGAEPQIRHALPAEHGFVGIGLESDQRPRRREYQR
jgi:hypothetical protein